MSGTHARHAPPDTHKPRARALGYLIAAVVNLVVLLVAHQYAAWIPWTQGVVTDAFPQVLWAIDLSVVTQVVGNLVLAVLHPRIMRRLGDLVFALVGLVGVIAFYQVYPFHLEAIVPLAGLDSVARFGLLIAAALVSIASVVHLFRLTFWWLGR